jgi:hypothetical protein
MASKKKTFQALKGTTFGQLFDLPVEADPPRINPIDNQEFDENVVAICKGFLYGVMMDHTQPSYVRIEASRELLNRALGKPVTKNFTAEVDPESIYDTLPKVIQRPKEIPPEPTE